MPQQRLTRECCMSDMAWQSAVESPQPTGAWVRTAAFLLLALTPCCFTVSLARAARRCTAAVASVPAPCGRLSGRCTVAWSPHWGHELTCAPTAPGQEPVGLGWCSRCRRCSRRHAHQSPLCSCLTFQTVRSAALLPADYDNTCVRRIQGQSDVSNDVMHPFKTIYSSREGPIAWSGPADAAAGSTIASVDLLAAFAMTRLCALGAAAWRRRKRRSSC